MHRRITLSQRGFSLVELMVGVVIGLLAMLIIMQVFSLAEEQRRTATAGNDAQTNGLIGSFAIERDIRMAGFGSAGLGCGSIKAFNTTRATPGFTLSGLPVTISTPQGSTSNQIQVLYGSSPYANVPAVVQGSVADSSVAIPVDSGIGFSAGQMIVVSQAGKDCALLQLSENSTQGATANITGPGTQWTLTAAAGVASPYNPPAETNIFPAAAGGGSAGYDVGAKVTNFGAMVSRAYFIQDNRLMMRDLLRDAAAGINPMPLVDGIIALRAVYGRDTDNDGKVDAWDTTAPANANQVIAIRYAIVARSGQYEKEQVSPATLTLWECDSPCTGPTIALRTDSEADANNRDRHYRYKIYQTTVPLRNVIWGKTL